MSLYDKITAPPQLTMEDTLYQAFSHFFHLDKSNAAFHCAAVRFSPITFRLAEWLWQYDNLQVNESLREVVLDLNQYEEDKGR